MRTRFLFWTRRLWPLVSFLLLLMAGVADVADTAPVSFAKLARLPTSTTSAFAPAADLTQTCQSLNTVITLLNNDQQCTALINELKQLRDGMSAQQKVQAGQAPGLLGAMASLIESDSLQADVEAGAPRYWLRRIEAAGGDASLLVTPDKRMPLVANFVSTVGIWAAIAAGLLGLGWLTRHVFGLTTGLGPHPTTRVLLIDAARKIGPWAISFAAIMRLERGTSLGFVLVLVLAYAIVWGAIITAGVAMLSSLSSGSVHRRVAVEYLFKHGMWPIFLTASLGARGDALVDPRVTLVLGGSLYLLPATVRNVVTSLMLAVGALWARRPIGQLTANRPLELCSDEHTGNQIRRLLVVFWPVPVLVPAGTTVTAMLTTPDNVDMVARRAVMMSLLLVAAFFLSALVRPRTNWRTHLRLTRSSPYLKRLKCFVGALVKFVIWIAFLELVLHVQGHTLVEVTHSSVNGKRIVDALVGLIGTTSATWPVWILLDTAILRALSPVSARVQPSTCALTILPLLRNGLKVTLVVTASIGVLANLGVDVTPLAAGAGVIGLTVGFGAQSLAQDFITGIFILMEDTISVGDVMDVGVATGSVINLTIRMVRLRDGTGAVLSIPFSQIKTVCNLLRDYSSADFEVRVAMEAEPQQAIDLMHMAADQIAGEPRFGYTLLSGAEIFGLDRFEGGAMIVKGRFKMRPQKQADVLRVFNVVLKDTLDRAHVPLAAPGTVLRTSAALEEWMAQVTPEKEAPVSSNEPPAAVPA